MTWPTYWEDDPYPGGYRGDDPVEADKKDEEIDPELHWTTDLWTPAQASEEKRRQARLEKQQKEFEEKKRLARRRAEALEQQRKELEKQRCRLYREQVPAADRIKQITINKHARSVHACDKYGLMCRIQQPALTESESMPYTGGFGTRKLLVSLFGRNRDLGESLPRYCAKCLKEIYGRARAQEYLDQYRLEEHQAEQDDEDTRLELNAVYRCLPYGHLFSAKQASLQPNNKLACPVCHSQRYEGGVKERATRGNGWVFCTTCGHRLDVSDMFYFGECNFCGASELPICSQQVHTEVQAQHITYHGGQFHSGEW